MSSRTIKAVRALAGFRLRLTWDQGVEVEVNLASDIKRLRALAALSEARLFARATVGEWGHCVVWPQDIEIGADSLWRDTSLAQGKNDAVVMREWRFRHGLTLQAAAEALGLSRRMLTYYESGEKSVPRTVLLATKGWETEQRQAA